VVSLSSPTKPSRKHESALEELRREDRKRSDRAAGLLREAETLLAQRDFDRATSTALKANQVHPDVAVDVERFLFRVERARRQEKK